MLKCINLVFLAFFVELMASEQSLVSLFVLHLLISTLYKR